MSTPEGFSTVNPYIFVKDADKFIKFLETAFDGKEIGRTTRNGRIANARVKIDESTVMVSEATDQFRAMPASYYLYVENADETYARASKCDIETLMEPMDMPYGDRQAGIKDSFGNYWWISTRLDSSQP